jgi:carbon monoxide dehydrogenase subunit G
MILENEFSVAAPMERVYDALTDAAVVVPSLPGARRSGRDGEQRTTKGELRITLGSTTIPYRGTIRLDEGDREAGALALTIDAREGRGRGILHASVSIRLRESHGSTTVSLRSEVDVDGRAAKVASDDIQSAVQHLLAEFGQNIQTRMNGAVAETAEAMEQNGAVKPMDGAADAAADTEPPAAAEAVTEAPAAAEAPVAVETPQPSPAGKPDAAHETPVRGTVRIMTTEPIASESVQPADGVLDVVRDELRRRPWLAPLLLLGGLSLLLLIRRRRR